MGGVKGPIFSVIFLSFLILVGSLFYWFVAKEHTPKGQFPSLVQTPLHQIKTIKITHSAHSFSLAYEAETADWTVQYDSKSFDTDYEAVHSFLLDLEGLIPERQLPNSQALDSARFGLDDPLLQINIHGKTDSEILIGKLNPTQTGYYVKTNHYPEIFMVSTHLIEPLFKPSEQYRNPLLFTGEPTSIKQIKLRFRSAPKTFLKYPDARWVQATPNLTLVNGDQINDLLIRLTNIKAQSFWDGTVNLSEFPFSISIVDHQARTQTIRFKLDDSQRIIAYSPLHQTQYPLSETVLNLLEDFESDLSPDHPFSLDRFSLVQLSIQTPTSSISIHKSPKGIWTAENKTQDITLEIHNLLTAMAQFKTIQKQPLSDTKDHSDWIQFRFIKENQSKLNFKWRIQDKTIWGFYPDLSEVYQSENDFGFETLLQYHD